MSAGRRRYALQTRRSDQRRSEGGCGPHRAALARGGKRTKIVKIHVKIQVVISYVFACNKNKALQLQRVLILSILVVFGCVRFDFVGITPILYFKQALQFPARTPLATPLKGGKFDHRPERPKVLLRHWFS